MGFSRFQTPQVKSDLQSGARNVFAERLTQEERSTLQEQATDTLSAARSLERSESMAERFGTLGSYRAVEIGRAVANDPGLMDRMYDRLDRLGLTGDHQRLAGSQSYAGVFADRDQANAAAGMALLLGYGEGDRELTSREQQVAREGGFGILADAFGGPQPAGIVPGRNADLDGRVPGYGGAQAAVNAGNKEISDLQADLVRSYGGSAIGRYQILDGILAGLIDRMCLSGNERFTPALQDRMALQLARDAGMQGWIGRRISDEQFAQNLSQIWAGLPRDASNESYYDGIQGNRATMDWITVLDSLRGIRSNATS